MQPNYRMLLNALDQRFGMPIVTLKPFFINDKNKLVFLFDGVPNV